MIRQTALAFVMMVAANCGSSTSPGGHMDSGGDGNPHDGNRVIDARAIDVGVFDFGCGGGPSCALDKVCCTMPGPPLTFGCVDPGACTANEEVLCDGPDECVVTPSTPVCCGIEKPDGTGTFPQCGTSAISTSCTTAAACPTHLSNSCSQTSKVQICHMSSECTDPNNNMCCTFMSGGASLSFCIDSLTASLGGGTCN